MNQITVASGYAGASAGAVSLYKKAPVFAVQDQTANVLTLTTNLNSQTAISLRSHMLPCPIVHTLDDGSAVTRTTLWRLTWRMRPSRTSASGW